MIARRRNYIASVASALTYTAPVAATANDADAGSNQLTTYSRRLVLHASASSKAVVNRKKNKCSKLGKYHSLRSLDLWMNAGSKVTYF